MGPSEEEQATPQPSLLADGSTVDKWPADASFLGGITQARYIRDFCCVFELDGPLPKETCHESSHSS